MPIDLSMLLGDVNNKTNDSPKTEGDLTGIILDSTAASLPIKILYLTRVTLKSRKFKPLLDKLYVLKNDDEKEFICALKRINEIYNDTKIKIPGKISKISAREHYLGFVPDCSDDAFKKLVVTSINSFIRRLKSNAHPKLLDEEIREQIHLREQAEHDISGDSRWNETSLEQIPGMHGFFANNNNREILDGRLAALDIDFTPWELSLIYMDVNDDITNIMQSMDALEILKPIRALINRRDIRLVIIGHPRTTIEIATAIRDIHVANLEVTPEILHDIVTNPDPERVRQLIVQLNQERGCGHGCSIQ